MHMMKKSLLLAISLLVGLTVQAQNHYHGQRTSLFEVLPVDRNDIIFLGNSITDGGEWSEIFENPNCKNRGISADRSEWVLERLDPIVKGQPKKLFLMIGINDLAVGVPREQVVENIGKILDRFAQDSPRTKCYVQSMLPVNGKQFSRHSGHYAHSEAIRWINQQLKVLCAERKIPYIDLYSALVNEEGLLDAAYTNDGLHLMGAGYLVWKALLTPYVK